MKVQAYLYFDGRCEEALAFYKSALGAEIGMLMRFGDSPVPPQDGCEGVPIPGDKIMHCSFKVGETDLLASDGRSKGNPKFEGISLTLNAPNIAEAEKLFAALSDGGNVQMPMTQTFFSPRFGMVADKFGVSWMVIVEA